MDGRNLLRFRLDLCRLQRVLLAMSARFSKLVLHGNHDSDHVKA